jgi:hypothetical protein
MAARTKINPVRLTEIKLLTAFHLNILGLSTIPSCAYHGMTRFAAQNGIVRAKNKKKSCPAFRGQATGWISMKLHMSIYS